MSLLPATVAFEPRITCQTTGITGFRDGRLTVLPETGFGGGAVEPAVSTVSVGVPNLVYR